MLRKAYVLEDPQTKRNKIRSGYLTLACRGPKRGRKCYIAPAFSGVLNKGEGNQKWLPHPCLLGGPKEGGNAMSPLHSRGSPTKGNKIKSGPLTLAFSGAPKRAEMLRKAYVLEDPQPSGQNQKWLPHPSLSGAQKRAEMLRRPCILGGPQQRAGKSKMATSSLPSRGPKRGRKCDVTPAFSSAPNKGEQNQKWLPHPCLLWGPQRGRKCYVKPMCSKIPNQADKIRSGYLTLACRGPKRGQKCYVAPAFSGVPKKGQETQKWPPHPCLLGGPKEGGNATSPLHSWGSPTKGEQNQKWLPHPCLLGCPKEGGNAT